MSIRSKSRKRLVVLLVSALVAVGLLFGGVSVVKLRRDAARRQGRDAGIAAVQQGDWGHGLELLSKYLAAVPSDSEALYHYAIARSKVPTKDRRHLLDACGAMYRVHQIEPENRDAQQKLLELFTQAGGSTEALATADDVLRREPDNAAAAYLRALALQQLRRFPEARQTAESLVAAHPDYYEAHRLLLELLNQTGVEDQKLVEVCRGYQESHPDDPRFRLLMAMTYSAVGNRAAAAQELVPLQDWTPQSPELAQLLVGQFQAVGNFDAALVTLRRAADALPELRLRQELIRRLWETGHHQEVLDRTKDLDLASADTDPYVLGYRGLALLAKNDRSSASAIADALLAGQPKSNAARAWSMILKSSAADPSPTPTAMLDVCRSAIELDPENPLSYYLRGQAYAEMGEDELAIAAWNDARKAAALWPQLYLRLSQSLLKVGRTGEALSMAAALHQLVPQDLAAAIVEARVWAAALRDGQTKEVEGLIVLLEHLRQTAPADAGVLDLQVQVLAELGRLDEARQAARRAAESTPPPSPRALAALSRLNREYALGLDPKMLEGAETGKTPPDLALEKALRLHEAGHEDQALACLKDPQDASPQEALGWLLVRAQYAQQTQSPNAAAVFAQIADTYPQSLPAQQAVLNSSSAWNDLSLIDRTIQRVQALSGDSGLLWKIARARWYLARQQSDKDLTAAVDLLESVISVAPDTIIARLLLSSAQEQLGNLTAAVDNLTTVLAQRPNMPEVRLDLVRLLYALGQPPRAAEELENVLAQPSLPEGQFLQAVTYLSRHGNLARAARLLETFLQQHPDNASAQLMLASIYRRQNQLDKTTQLCEQLLQHPTAAAVEFAADFYASIDKPELAQGTLDKLSQIDLPPGTASLIRANHALRQGSNDDALNLLQQGVVEAPSNALAWQSLISLCVRMGKIDESAAAITGAAEKSAEPRRADFQAIALQLELLKRLSTDQTLRWLLVAFVEDAAHRDEILEALSAVDAAQQRGAPGADVTRVLRQLADRYPRLLPLQNTVVSRYLQEDQPHLASEVASRTMQAFPDAAEPAWLAAQALAAAGRWPEALSVAEEWRQRSSSRPLAADLLIAQARLRLNQPEQALTQIQPYVEQALQNPDAFAPVILSNAVALIAAGHEDQAQAMLKPLMASNARWRQAWIQLAVLSVPDAAHAADWLRQVQPQVPADDASERVLLARAWYSLGAKSDNSEYRQTGKSMLQALAQRPDAGADAVLNLALVLDLEQDLPGAEKLYRQAISLEPNQSAALNNLAMILARQGGEQRLQEASTLAQQAIKATPDAAAYYDTLADIQVQLKQLSDAAESLRAASRLEPRNLQWQARLARVLQQNGQLKEAQTISASIKRLDPQLRDLNPEERQLVESLSQDVEAATRPASTL